MNITNREVLTNPTEANNLGVAKFNETAISIKSPLMKESNVIKLNETNISVQNEFSEEFNMTIAEFIKANKAKILEDELKTKPHEINHTKLIAPTKVINDKITYSDKKIEIFDIKKHYEHAQLVKKVLPCVELPEINMPQKLKRRLIYDYIMTTQVNNVCCSN